MKQQHLFVSDIHYGAFEADENLDIEEDLISLIQYCSDQNIRLNLLGDLFDYWMEYQDYHPEFGSRLLEMLQTHMSVAGPVLYITGNHDNWTSGYFSSLGFDVEPEYRILKMGGYRVMVLHGDGLKNRDINLPRPMLHRFLRNKKFIWLYQFLLPPGPGLKLMKKFSGYCRKRPVPGTGRLDGWASEYLSKSEIDFVICGHDHVPRHETFPYGTYINSGAFYAYRTAVKYTNGDFELVIWDGKNKNLAPFTAQRKLIRDEQIFGT
jgi:UDP-2,3-diacylglucosamine hydrolase